MNSSGSSHQTSDLRLLTSFYLNSIIYYIAGTASVVFVLSYFQPALFRIAGLILLLLGIAIVVDSLLLYSKKNGVNAKRETTDRFSIGDPNKVTLHLDNHYPFPVRVSMIDELPVQFQEWNWLRKARVESGKHYEIEYLLKPLTRG